MIEEQHGALVLDLTKERVQDGLKMLVEGEIRFFPANLTLQSFLEFSILGDKIQAIATPEDMSEEEKIAEIKSKLGDIRKLISIVFGQEFVDTIFDNVLGTDQFEILKYCMQLSQSQAKRLSPKKDDGEESLPETKGE